MEMRRIPGMDRPVSVLGISIGPWVLRPGPGDPARRLRTLLEGALDRGITLFDVRAGEATARVESALAPLVEGRREDLLVLSELVDGPGPESAGGTRPDSDALLAASTERLGGRSADLLTVPERTAMEPGGLDRLAVLERRGELRSFGIRMGSSGLVPDGSGPDPRATRARFLDLAYNLITPSPGSGLIRSWQAAGRAVLVHDVHAAGRLDGRRLRLGGVDSPGRPTPLSELRREYGPLLRLSESPDRPVGSLPAAALRFAVAPDGVASALLAPESLLELDAFLTALDPTRPGAAPDPSLGAEHPRP
ncbi:MAG: aldo/keto reductase [Thermoplasmata archaeon]